MTKLILDASVVEKLPHLTDVVQLVTADGKPIGTFYPSPIPTGWVPIGPELSEEELERRFNSGEKRYTTAELLKHLETL